MTGVRRVRADEAQRLRELRLRALAADPQAFAISHKREAADPPERWTELAAGSEAGTERAVFVTEDWSGMAGAYVEDADVVLWGMWVDPARRGHSLARALVESVAGWAAERGAARVRLGVYEDADVAAFYERLGFTESAAGECGDCDRTFFRALEPSGPRGGS